MSVRRLVWVVAAVVFAGLATGCRRTTTRPVTTQVVVLGFDGADPNLLAKWAKEGKLPNLARLAQSGTFEPLGTTNPPESPVSWASFATGLNPGGTGIFDFLRRDPKTYLPELALVTVQKPEFLLGEIPIKAPKLTNERGGVPFYKAVADAGYKTTVIRMPLEFPPTNLPGGKLWAGLGVPDLRGTWGTFFYFGSELTPWDVGDTEFGGELHRRPRRSHREVAAPHLDPGTLRRLAGWQRRHDRPGWDVGDRSRKALEPVVPSEVQDHALPLSAWHLPLLRAASLARPAALHVAAESGS